MSPAPTSRSVTVDNCGHTWTFARAPRRVVVQKDTTVLTLAHLGVLDRVVARAGEFPAGYYDAEVNRALAALPSVSDTLNASGHLQVAREAVVARDPDLVLGFSDTVNPQSMGQVPVLDEPALCGSTTTSPTFDDVYAHVEFYGDLFDRDDAARAYEDELRQRVAQAVPQGRERSAVIVYPSLGGGTTYAYGGRSMAVTVARAAGLTPLFAEVDRRVFEVSREHLIVAQPQVIIAVHSVDDGSTAWEDTLARLRADFPDAHVIPMLLNHMDPATPLVVDGLDRLNAELDAEWGPEHEQETDKEQP